MMFLTDLFLQTFPHLKLPKLPTNSQPVSSQPALPRTEMKSEASLASRVVLEVAGLDYVILSDPTSQSDRGKQQNSQGELRPLYDFVCSFIYTPFFYENWNLSEKFAWPASRTEAQVIRKFDKFREGLPSLPDYIMQCNQADLLTESSRREKLDFYILR